MATSLSSTSLMLGPSVSDSITDLEKQIQLINDAIGSALSSQQSSAQQHCPKCTEYVATLGGLQSHVQEAMKRLKNHVQKLETSCQSTTMAVNTQQSSSGGASQQIRGRKVSKNINGNNKLQQTNSAPDQPTKSFREMLRERKKAGQASSTPDSTPTTAAETAAREIKTLDDIIMSCAPYLTGSPTEYTSWLRNELGVETISDLAKAVNERPGLLVAGNGIVGMWQKRKFCEAVLAAAATSVPSE